MTNLPQGLIINLMSERQIILDWMDEVLSAKGWKPKNWADATAKPKLAATTITRFRKDKHAPVLKQSTLNKLANAAGVASPLGMGYLHPIDNGLLFEVSEYVLGVLAALDRVIFKDDARPDRVAEAIVLVYGDMAEAEAADRAEQLVKTTENVIRITDRQNRMK